MDEAYLDMHICLGCKQTILGLDAYVQHKRYDCSSLKSKEVPTNDQAEQKNSSSPHFNSDFSSAIASNISSDDFKELVGVSYSHLSSLLEAVTGSVSTGQAPGTDANQTSAPVPCTTQSSVDLTESIVLYTTENCSFFDSLQLKSRVCGGKSQTDEKYRNLENLNSLECPTNKIIENELPFLQQSKQLEQLCSLTSPVLKIESDLFESADCNNVLTSGERKINERDSTGLCEAKSDGETLTLCWKNDLRKENGSRSDNFAYDHSKALQIACMFNNLEFESDSDDFMSPDANDLLNFSDMEDDPSTFNHSNCEDKSKERNSATGKLESYKHSGKLDAYVKSQGKLFCLRKENSTAEQKPLKCHTRGKQIATKWRPGERPDVLARHHPHTSRGKWQGAEECEEEEQEEPEEGTDVEDANHDIRGKDVREQKIAEQEDSLSENKQEEICKTENCETDENMTRSRQRQGARRVKSECKICNKVFSTKAGFEYHMKSNLHRKRIEKELSFTRDLDKERPCVKLECTLCDKIFLSKFSFARHLLTPFHSRRAKYNEKHKVICSKGLEAGIQLLMQRLQRFQCRICDFYTDEEMLLVTHLKSSEHSEHVSTMTGPFICVRCQHICHSNDDMIFHVNSAEHAEIIKSSSQPCVLKEKRCKIACPKCDAVIHSAVQLVSHRKTCTTDDGDVAERQNESGALKCPHCSATFMAKFNLTVHIRRLHAKDKPFQCRTCEKAFADSGALKLHRQGKQHIDAVTSLLAKREEIQNQFTADDDSGESKQGYQCKQCDFVADSYSDVVVHRSKMHVPPDCTVCGIRLANQSQHDRHMMSKSHVKKVEESKISFSTLFTCDKCPRKFYTVRSMKMHEMNHQLAASRIAKTNGSGPDDIELICFNLKKESKLPNGKVQCPKCAKYLTKIGILPHLRSHAGSFPFQCSFCGKKFVDASIMRRHLKVHLGIRSYRCKFCSREFDRRLTLDTHLIREHKDSAGIVPSHLCNICGHKFIQLSQLNAHLKFHDKSVRCLHPGCTHTFRYRSEMLIHMQVHTKETSFLCDECGYAGKTRTQLSRHRRVHTGEKRYRCSLCPYIAAHIANLKRHERVHTGNKPYQCPHCKYSCNTQENLRKHILKTKRHAGQPVYPCPHCEFGCNSATEFQSHLETMHNISRNHLPSVVAGLYQRDADVRPF